MMEVGVGFYVKRFADKHLHFTEDFLFTVF